MKIEKQERTYDWWPDRIVISNINTIEELDEAIEPIMDDIRNHFYWAEEDRDTGEPYPKLCGFQLVVYSGINPDLTKEDVYKSLVSELSCPELEPRLTLHNYDSVGVHEWKTHPEDIYYPKTEYDIVISPSVVGALCKKYKEFLPSADDELLDTMPIEEVRKILGQKIFLGKVENIG